ncbi:cullin-3a-related [Anaeramoeba ignava]|uniref:Cullin-3a-related n=1 Tax=Anaeramoeba ignava TaxID=1746090 RepID=A0A9Q0LPV1_ANAIG|nr:cullin-3a-related [Anaeramoeba ignava]|eukprot:Anaeramoba_ignava/a348095_183.p1 GENE.a348095_183~~a348095_183.p1  ORF type:complete len:737 (+),score=178.68 a348095_183:10-2220(+)
MSRKMILRVPKFQEPKRMEKSEAQRLWLLLKDAIVEVQHMNASTLSFEELYRSSYSLVIAKRGDILYTGLEEVNNHHTKNLLDKIAQAVDERFLIELNSQWQQYKLQQIMIHDILMYLDRMYVKEPQLKVFDLGMFKWKQNVLIHSQINDRLVRMLLGLIHMERNGEVIDGALMKSLIQMYVDVSLKEKETYKQEFEERFLLATSHFYKSESNLFITNNSCGAYLKKVEIRLIEEEARIKQYLDESTGPKLIKACEDELIANHMQTMIEMETGCRTMIQNDRFNELKLMYRLFQRVENGLVHLKNEFAGYVRNEGHKIVNQPENLKDPNALITSLIEIRNRFEKTLSQSFANNRDFINSVNTAFESFLNENDKLSESLALFIDKKLRGGFKDSNDQEIDVIMNKVILLFRFLSDKDVFKKFYEHYLAKRLLSGRSFSEDLERTMISKFKQECGNQFTSKMEGMFTDMRLSKDALDGFKNYLQTSVEMGKLPKIDMSVRVLTQGFWPTFPPHSCTLPPLLSQYCDLFTKYYCHAHTGRRIIWQTNIGTAEVTFRLPKKTHVLALSTYQMLIMLLFNDAEKLSLKQMAAGTSISFMDIQRSVKPLYSGKYKVLKRTPAVEKSKELSENDIFELNLNLKCKLHRIKFAATSQTDSEPERQHTRQRVDEDRKIEIDAAIVRIMKSRKALIHNDLIVECTKQLSSRFVPQTSMIKKRIENLIEREYLERFPDDRRRYRYLA